MAKSQDLQNNNHLDKNENTLDAKVVKLSLNDNKENTQTNHDNNNNTNNNNNDDDDDDDDDANPGLFDSNLLAELNPSDFLFKYTKFETITDKSSGAHSIELGDSLILRPLRRNDFDCGYMSLMSQLTQCGQVTNSDFQRRFDQMRRCAGTYYTCVVEDTSKEGEEGKSKIVASTTLVYEQKFIRGTAARGRIEDVVVDVEYRGKRLSKILLDVLTKMSEKLGCYKVSLECKDQLKGHYEAFGFKLEAEQNYLCRRFV
jgi:glucosamine-phosphate N-acetyltransferase